MANDSTAWVYKKDSVEARSILTYVISDDIGAVAIPCTFKVLVKNARFKEHLLSNGLHRPYLRLYGEVSDVFIEDDEDRYFPSGTKALHLSEPIEVEISYLISTSELHGLINRGLYYDDFKVPDALVDNVIEIPGHIVYTYIYDTPIGMVDIDRPFELKTCTKSNHYDGIFNGCAVSLSRTIEESLSAEQIMEHRFASKTPNYQYESIIEKKYINKYEDSPPREPEDTYVPDRAEDKDKIASKIEDIVGQHAKQYEENVNEIRKDTTVNKNAAALIRRNMMKQNQQSAQNQYDNMSAAAQLLSGESTHNNNVKVRYNDIKKAVKADASGEGESLFAHDKQQDAAYQKISEANKNNSDSHAGGSEGFKSVAQQVDVAMDNKALNEGITDISGFGSESMDTSKMSAAQKREFEAKKSRDVARRVDTALDNQALNRGETDIAGQGSASKKPSADDIMRLLRGKGIGAIPAIPKPSGSDSPNFL